MELNSEHKAILLHTAKNKIYCGDSKEMLELCKNNLMEFAGRKSFVPDPYYALTDNGISMVNYLRNEPNDPTIDPDTTRNE